MGPVNDFDECVADFMDDFGGPALLTITDEQGTYSPSTGDYIASTVGYTVRAILLDLTLRNNGLGTDPNTLIQMGDKRCFIQPLNKTDPTQVMPKINPSSDRVTMGGITYKIITVKQTNTDTTNPILFELILRE